MENEPIELLLVEDNPGDIRLTQEALKSSGIRNSLHVVRDGEEALEFLFRKGRHADAPQADLVLLDLNLPRVDGRDVLAQIRATSELSLLPVVVLTSSDAERDIVASYEKRANCFVTKPLEFADFVHIVQSIEEFWFKIVKLPPKRILK